MAIGFDIGSVVSGISSIFGQSQQNRIQQKIAREQLKAQAEENQKTREYNKALAEWQNSENIAQWNRENEYNSPSAQMKRYRDAGLNADLIYNQQNTSAPSPVMTAGEAATSQDMSPMQRLVPERNILQAAGSEISKGIRSVLENNALVASTDKTKEEVKGQKIENNYASQLFDGKLNLYGAQIDLSRATEDMTKKQIILADDTLKNTSKQRELWDAQSASYLASASKMKHDSELSDKKYAEYVRQFDATMRYKFQDLGLRSHQIDEMINIAWDQADLYAQSVNQQGGAMAATASVQAIQEKLLTWTYEHADMQEFRNNLGAFVSAISSLTNSACNAISTVKGVGGDFTEEISSEQSYPDGGKARHKTTIKKPRMRVGK